MTQINFCRDHGASRELIGTIRKFYEDHPSYSKEWVDTLKFQIYTNERGDLSIESNLGERLANVLDVEQRVL